MNPDDDLYKEFNISKRKSINLVHNLIARELDTNSSILGLTSLFSGQHRNERTRFNHLKRIYLAITPSYTIINVKTPNCYLRRFSPDGRYLVAFNQNLNGIQIFLFKGSSAGVDEIQNFSKCNQNKSMNSSSNSKFQNSPIDRTDFENTESCEFRTRAFDTYFVEKANLKLIDNNELINRECTLFYKTSYLIVASSEVVSEDNLPPYDQLTANNESLHLGFIENYTIFLVNLTASKLCDKIHFKADKLKLTHNQSLCLFRNTFTVLSQQNQTIYVYKIVPKHGFYKQDPYEMDYKFVLIQQIGRFCYSDDSDFIRNFNFAAATSLNEPSAKKIARINSTKAPITRTSSVANTQESPSVSSYRSLHHQRHNTVTKPFNETCFTNMKHRILTFFYKEAMEKNLLSQFYANLNTILNLKMYKMQLLDSRHVLIKYVNIEHMTNERSNTPMNASTTPYVSYGNQSRDISTTPTTPSTSNINIQSNLTSSNLTTNVTPVNNTTLTHLAAANTSSAASTITSSPAFSNIINEQYTPFYFILYDMESTKILNILRNTSAQLLDVYENFQDYFSLTSMENVSSHTDRQACGNTFSFHTLPSNNIYAKQIIQRQIKNLSKLNNNTDLTKCILSELPLNSQSYAYSPYLDHNLFSYDMKLISNFDRPKPIGDQTIKFNDRDTGRFSFRLYPGKQMPYPNNAFYQHASKRLVAFIWHPHEPFCISLQRTTQEYNVNFHVYSKNNLI